MVVDGEKSCVLPVFSSVPQGSVLDPFCFMFSLTKTSIRLHWSILLEAPTWMLMPAMSLQPSKCCYMLVTRKRTCSLPPLILCVQNSVVVCAKCEILGNLATQDFSWSLHISHLCAKARQLVGLCILPLLLQTC